MKRKLYIITGVNCAGKTTVVKKLKNKLPGYKFYHFDLKGIPKKPDKKWRNRKIRYWLGVARKNFKKGLATVLDGYIIPSEVYKIRKKVPVKFCLLDVYKKDIHKRLKKRLKNKKKQRELKVKFGMNTEDCIKKNIEHARLLRKEVKKIKEKTFNTSRNSVNVTTDKVKKYLVNN